MIHDMELLLNKVCDNEIKSYLHEAINCYSVGAYRACVIISVIGGIHDLHNKLKFLASSDKKFANLEGKVSKSKEELKPYERDLIEGCCRPEIDLLNPSESKELLRCLDIRNSCAHPSGYICTAECSRYVFSTIIDILASKPALLGCQCINSIYDKINADTYFCSENKSEIKIQVDNQVKSCSSRIIVPLAKKLVKGIMNKDCITNKNKLYFLSNLSQVLSDSFDNIVEPLFLKSEFHSELMVIMSTNVNVVENLSNENIKRLLRIFKDFTESNEVYNNVIIEILLSNRLSDKEYDNSIVELLNYNYNEMTDNQTDIWINIVSSNTYSTERIFLIKSDYIENIRNRKLRFKSQKFQEVFILCNDEELYQKLVDDISYRVRDYDYQIVKSAISELNGLSKKFIDKLSHSSISTIMYSILYAKQGGSWEAQTLFRDIESKDFYKRYIEEIIPSFNDDEFIKMINNNLNADTLYYFVCKVTSKSTNFDKKFISIAKNCSSKIKTEWNIYEIEKCIDKLNKSKSNS